MKCPLSGLDCQRAQVRLTDGPMLAYQCVEHGALRYILLSPEAMARFEADWAEAREIIAASKSDDEYRIGG
jgi:hypothetical protein